MRAVERKPVVTHAEILCYAIAYLEKDINDMVAYLDGITEKEAYLNFYVGERKPKLDMLKTLYKIETGTDYR